MIALIDTIFNPILNWLNGIQENLLKASVPVSRPIDPSGWLAPFSVLGDAWMMLITNILAMGFIYVVIYIVMNSVGLIEQFRNVLKWW